MAKDTFEFDDSVFDSILNSSGIRAIVDAKAQQVLHAAQATAPTRMRGSITVEHRQSGHREVAVIEASHIEKSHDIALAIEAKTGFLARSLKKAKG